MSDELTVQTTFYALTAPLPGYTLEDQVLGGLTLREWLRKYGGSDGEDGFIDWIWNHPTNFFKSEEYANAARAGDNAIGRRVYTVEPFTPVPLLARLREMGEEANEE